MALEVDLFWSFRSPYSYLATGRLVRMTETCELNLRVRPVLPLAVRDPEFFQRFGQDRLDLLVWRMQQHGLSSR